MAMNPKFKCIELSPKGDDRGKLVVAESFKEVPFEIKRIFYMYDTLPDVTRGKHANRYSQFMLFCIKGSVDIFVDDGTYQQTITLDHPNTGLFLESMVWKEMYNFSHDALLLVLADTLYDPDEYIYHR